MTLLSFTLYLAGLVGLLLLAQALFDRLDKNIPQVKPKTSPKSQYGTEWLHSGIDEKRS